MQISSIIDEDIWKSDRKTIDTQKVVFSLWQNRDNATSISTLASTLSKFVEEKRVFNEIEYYLPQLAHLIIHLRVDWPNQSLERLAVAICQTSVHAALQLNFILIAAMEDYQPELSSGIKNPQSNPELFFRCARILQNVERAVVFGSPFLTADEEASFLDTVTHSQLADLQESEKAQRMEAIVASNAQHYSKHAQSKNNLSFVSSIDDNLGSKSVIQNEGTTDDSSMAGNLLYKRIDRKNIFYSKIWKSRFFRIEQRVLFCYRTIDDSLPLRAIPLHACVVRPALSRKYDYAFDICNDSTNTRYHLRAPDKKTYDLWIAALEREILGDTELMSLEISKPSITAQDRGMDDPSQGGLSLSMKAMMKTHNSFMKDREGTMTPSQKKKYLVFQQQRGFIVGMTDICEKLRFLDRSVRKAFLQQDLRLLQIPPFAWSPLSRSVDRYRCILRPLPAESHAFSTKARCPALILFEMEDHPQGLDVASFLAHDLWEYSEDELRVNRAILVSSDDVNDDGSLIESSKLKESKIRLVSRRYSAWQEEGFGMDKINGKEKGFTYLKDRTLSVSMHESLSPTSHRTTPPADIPKHRKPLLSSETFATRSRRIRNSSPYGAIPSWSLDGLIAKSNDDVRQEVFVMQLIVYLQTAFQAARVPVWLYTYKILSTSKSTGLIQFIPDATSLDGLKKSEGFPGSLRKYFEQIYGEEAHEDSTANPVESPALKNAIREYTKSLAGYSIVCYLLAIKDRHNGNIMIDTAGHLIHIDFGFVFGLAPGKAFSMEKGPFKLNEEMVEVMGGLTSPYFVEFCEMCTQAFLIARHHVDALCNLMEIMMDQSNYPAFRYNPNAIRDFRQRFHLEVPDEEMDVFVNNLILKSYKHKGADLYDDFQVLTNGIAK